MVYIQGMILPINHIKNWKIVHQNKQDQINFDADRGNKSQTNHNYLGCR